MTTVHGNPLCDMLHNPDVLEFLFRCTATQADNHDRFNPTPQWFHKPSTVQISETLGGGCNVDMVRFRDAVDQCDIAKICHRYQRIHRDSSLVRKGMPEAVYHLLQFIVGTVTLKLQHVELYVGRQRFDQFRVNWDAQREDMFVAQARTDNTYSSGIQYLYHGSPLFNWHSIIRNGVRVMSNTTYMSNAAAYGTGVYLSDQLSMSYDYARRGVRHRYGNAIIVGVYEVYDAARYRKTAGIYVVPKEEYLLLRYLVYVDRPENIAQLGHAMNKQLAGNSERRIKTLERTAERRANRIQRDISQLREEGWSVTGNENTYQVCRECTMQVTFPPSYPGVPPVVAVDERVSCDTEWNVAWRLSSYLQSVYWSQDSLKNQI